MASQYSFSEAKSGIVFDHILKVTKLSIERKNLRIIPSSIYTCNSTSHYLGSTYPGKTLTVKLIVPVLIYTSKSSLTANVENYNAPDQHCTIIEATETNKV